MQGQKNHGTDYHHEQVALNIIAGEKSIELISIHISFQVQGTVLSQRTHGTDFHQQVTFKNSLLSDVLCQ